MILGFTIQDNLLFKIVVKKAQVHRDFLNSAISRISADPEATVVNRLANAEMLARPDLEIQNTNP